MASGNIGTCPTWCACGFRAVAMDRHGSAALTTGRLAKRSWGCRAAVKNVRAHNASARKTNVTGASVHSCKDMGFAA